VSSIQKRPNGKWRARYRDDQGKEHSRHFDRKVDAQRHLDAVTASLLTGTYVDPTSGKVTLASFFDDWSSRQVWAPATLRTARNAVKGCTFRDVPLDRVRRSHVETWVKSMTTTMQPSTIATRMRFVRGVLRGAVRDQVLGTDPSAGVVLPRQRRAEHRMVIPTSEQVGWLLEAVEEAYRPFIAVCAFAGLRIGEAAGLQVGDVDFLRRTLHVQRQAQNNGGVVEVSAPKAGSERVVSIPDELATLLAQHVERIGVFGDERWLFPGAPPTPASLRYWFGRAASASGVDGLTPHDLRHYFASGLIASGCDVVTVQRALGHAQATVTLNTYSHLWPTAEDKTRTAAAGLMRAALESLADSSRTGEPATAADTSS
jgi:integrase